jgi:ribosomal protein S18 acetylase RimI-like enzyme
MYAIRAAQPSDCDAIAEMVRDLARDIGAPKIPKVTGDDLRARAFGNQALLMLAVAALENTPVAAAVGAFTFSTWRGTPGLYLVDLYVKPEARNARLGEKLLKFVARQAWEKGARFVRLEIDRRNSGAERFYERLGFQINEEDKFLTAEETELRALADSSE